MERKRWISLLTAMACLLLGTPAPTQASDHITAVNGTFIQPWLYMTYNEAQWEAEMQAMQAIGVEYLVMGDVANQNTDDSWTVYYPSKLDFLEDGYVYDAVGTILYYCEKYDMKLYLGMGLDCGWESDLTTESGREANRAYMERCNQITTELYNTYKSQYPDTYYGFYFVTELFNTHHMETDAGIDAYAEGLDEMFTMVIDNCNFLNPEMPLLFSPYVNIFGYGFSSINRDRFTEYWAEVLSRIPFRDGDMICPQDSCGGGGNDIAHLGEWMAAYRHAVDRANAIRGTELLLGTNAELFVSPDAARMSSPHGVSYVGTKDVRDFATRLEIAQPYTDALFCFAYPHHYSPINAIPAFHENFVTYLQTGEIESIPPTPPTTVRTETVISEDAPHLQLTLYGMTDNTSVAQTNIYKNGKFYDYLVAGTAIGGSGANTVQNVWIDYDFDLEAETAVYEFACVDVCGNVSEKSRYIVTPELTDNAASADIPNTDAPQQWEKTALDYLSYTVSGNGIRITDCDPSVEELIIPDTIEGLPVNVIDWYAFERCSKLRSVTIPDTVTHISRFAFAHCISLETVNLPSSLYAIEQYAFHDCPKLQGIALPEHLAIIEPRAFYGCSSITEVTIPAACSAVGNYAFLDCISLHQISISGTETSFGERAMGYDYKNGYVLHHGFLLDAPEGTGTAYAEEHGIRLTRRIIRGDVNADGSCTVLDAVMLQKYLLGAGTLDDWQAGDLSGDRTINGFDLCMMKQSLLQNE